MRIAVSGTFHIGKTTYIQDFISNWPKYKSKAIGKKVTDKKHKNDKLNFNADEKSLEADLNATIDQVINLPKKSNILLDKCVLDNLVFTLWCNSKEMVSDEYVKKVIKLCKETLVFYDIIFYMPLTKQTPIDYVVPEKTPELENYRKELDVLYKELNQRYLDHSLVFYPFEHELGCPAIIEMYGDRRQRIELAKLYINPNGDSYGDADNLITQTPFNADLELLKADHLKK